MHERVAVDLARRGEEEAGALRLRQAEAVVGAEAPDLQGLDRHLEVVDRRRRAGEVHHDVDGPGHPDEAADVVLDEREARSPEEVLDVGGRARDEVVDAHDLVAAVEQRVGEVRAEEPGTAGDDDAGHSDPPDAAVGEAAAAQRLPVEQVAGVDDALGGEAWRRPCRSRASGTRPTRSARARASAPSQAAYGSATISMPSTRAACRPPTPDVGDRRVVGADRALRRPQAGA